MKRILIGTMAVMMTVPCFAAGENVLTSKPYVDDAVSTRQDKIPAANPSNTNLGETVMTYTPNGNGEIGERELFTGGPYDAATDGDKLITASALKSAFTLPETQTTKLVCANPGTCDLWTITEQTAYGRIDLMSIMGMSEATDNASSNPNGMVSGNPSTYGVTQDGTCDLWTITNQTAYGISGNGTTTIDLMSLIGNVRGAGYTVNDYSGRNVGGTMLNSIISGDPLAFAVDYGDKGMIKGHGRCSSQEGDNNDYTWTNPTISSTLPDDSDAIYCYFTVEGYTPLNGTMTALSAPWVFREDYSDYDELSCVSHCPDDCARFLFSDTAGPLALRAAVFNSVQ